MLARDRAEHEWLDQLRVGDPLAFERDLPFAYYAPLCAFAHSYVRCHETAEEIVQDLFCWIWDRRFTLEMPHGMRLWLFTAVRNRSLNAFGIAAWNSRLTSASRSMHDRTRLRRRPMPTSRRKNSPPLPREPSRSCRRAAARHSR